MNVKIIDLRPFEKGKNTRIIECKEKEILFETYRKLNEKYYFSINIYDMNKEICREIYKYEVTEAEWNSQDVHLYKDKIIIIKTHNLNRLEVDKINRKDGSDLVTYSIDSKEEITSIPIFINENYILFYADIDKKSIEEEKYLKDSDCHFDYRIYLYDLNERKIYLIKDFRMIGSFGVEYIRKLPIFIHRGEEYLIWGENYCDDWEYEDIYKAILNKKIDKNKVDKEALYYIKLNDFVEDIKQGKKSISFQMIGKRHFDGWIRFFYRDENYVYYREKDFINQKEKIIKMSNSTLDAVVTGEIDHSKVEGRVIYDTFSGTPKVYEEIDTEKENKIEIKIRGIYNCDYNLDFSIDKFQEGYREKYYFMGLIEGRYIIVSGWCEDEKDEYYDLYYIREIGEESASKYIGNFEIYGDKIVTYSTGVVA